MVLGLLLWVGVGWGGVGWGGVGWGGGGGCFLKCFVCCSPNPNPISNQNI